MPVGTRQLHRGIEIGGSPAKRALACVGFSTHQVRKEVRELLGREVALDPDLLQFRTITDYIVLVVYLANALRFQKREVKALVRRYRALTDELRSKVPARVFDTIVHTDNRKKIDALSGWLKAG